MAESFKCPMCAAPLPYDGQAVTVRCPYCTNTVIVPDELRAVTREPERNVGGQMGQFGSVGDMIDQAMRLGEVKRLVRSGEKIQAIKLYRELTGLGLAEAKEDVERLERGEPLTIQQTVIGGGSDQTGSDRRTAAIAEVKELLRAGNKIGAIKVFREAFGCGLKEAKDAVEDIESGRPLTYIPASVAPQIVQVGEIMGQVGAVASAQGPKAVKAAKGCSVGVVIIVLVFLVIGFVIFINFRSSPTKNTNSKNSNSSESTFAHNAMAFGEEGMGPGQFKDARSVSVDDNGRIYVAEYQGGRIQVFNSAGKFQTQWSADRKAVVLGLAADRRGLVYIVHPGRIVKYNASNGENLGDLPNLNSFVKEYYSAVAVALDGNVYAVGGNSKIVKITPSGQVSTAVDVQKQAGEEVDLEQIAIDGSGHIYGLDTHDGSVLKFGANGRFMTRFGGKGTGTGQFTSPSDLAVDGQGRVFVADAGRGVHAFSEAGQFLALFGPKNSVYGIAFASDKELIVCSRNDHRIFRYEIDK